MVKMHISHHLEISRNFVKTLPRKSTCSFQPRNAWRLCLANLIHSHFSSSRVATHKQAARDLTLDTPYCFCLLPPLYKNSKIAEAFVASFCLPPLPLLVPSFLSTHMVALEELIFIPGSNFAANASVDKSAF